MNDSPTTDASTRPPATPEFSPKTSPAAPTQTPSHQQDRPAPQYIYTAGLPHGVYLRAKVNTLAIVALASGIVGLVLVPLVGSIVAIITGHVSLEQMKETGEAGRGQALAGTMMGYVGLAFGVPALISFFAFLPVMIVNIEKYL